MVQDTNPAGYSVGQPRHVRVLHAVMEELLARRATNARLATPMCAGIVNYATNPTTPTALAPAQAD